MPVSPQTQDWVFERIKTAVDAQCTLVARSAYGVSSTQLEADQSYSVLGYGSMRDGSSYLTLASVSFSTATDDESIFTLDLPSFAKSFRDVTSFGLVL